MFGNIKEPSIQKATMKIQLDDAFLLEANINYTIIHYACGKQVLCSYTLKRTAELLKLPKNFVRIHRSFIINKAYIKTITPKPQQIVILHNGMELSVARRRGI